MLYICEECGNTEEWSERNFADSGEPVCHKDDNDMVEAGKTVHVFIEGGVCQDVINLPKGWNWELHDKDNENG